MAKTSTLKTLLKQLSTFIRVAAFVARPFKSLAIFRHYFVISAQTRNDRRLPSSSTGDQKDQRFLLQQFQFLFAVLTYSILLHAVFFTLQTLTPFSGRFSSWAPTLHILLSNPLYLFRLPAGFHLLLMLECLFGIYCFHVVYFRPNDLINGRMEEILFGNKKRKRGVSSSSFSSVDAATRELAIIITNSCESFVLLFGGCLFYGFFQLTLIFFEHFSPLTSQLKLCACFLLYLVHALAVFIFVYAIAFIVIFVGAYSLVGLAYFHLAIRRNTSLISRQHTVVTHRRKEMKIPILCRLLRSNVAIFRVVFAGNAFLNDIFLAFLLVNFPVNALFSVMIVFGQNLDHFSLAVLTVFVAHEVVGTVLIHIWLARFSRHLHSGGVHLVRFSARSFGITSEEKSQQNRVFIQKLPAVSFLKGKLFIWTHTMRLLTTNRYGFTYGFIGAPVTMRTIVMVQNSFKT